MRGRGFAYALYVHSKFPGYGAAWSAWIADVAVNKATGDVSVTRVVAGQDSGLMINPDGVRHQIHGNVIQSTSRALMEEVSFDRSRRRSREWGAYPDHQIPGDSKDRRADAAAAGSAAARRRRIRLGPERGGDRQRHLRRHRRPVPRTAVHARTDSGGTAGARTARHDAGRAAAERAPRSTDSDRWHNPFARRRGVLATAAAVVCTAAIGIAAALLPWRSIAPIAPAGCVGVFGRHHRARPATCCARRLRGLPHRSIKRHPQCRRPALETPFGIDLQH